MKKVLLFFLLTLCACVGTYAANDATYDFSEVNSDGQTIYYRYVESPYYCEVVSGPEQYKGVIRIPDYVTERRIPVVGIGVRAFAEPYEHGLKEVYLPSNAIYIDALAFHSCWELTKVSLNEGLMYIGQIAFENCDRLSEINVPQSLEFVDYLAFHNCVSLRPIYNSYCKTFFSFPTGNMGNQCYKIPDGIETIGISAFNFSEVKEVIIPNSVKKIEEWGFNGCTFEKVNLPNSIKVIEEYAFGQTKLRHITIPSSVDSIGGYCFVSSNLESVVFECELDSIPKGSFDCCSELKSVKYPASVHKFCDYCFANCGFTELPDMTNIDTLGIGVFYANDRLKKVTIPDGIKVIPYDAFNLCMELREVNLPSTLVRIDGLAFWQNTSLKSIVIPDGVKSIGERAFEFCENLKDVNLGKGLQSIGAGAFAQIEALQKIDIPQSVTEIGSDAFGYCSNLKDVIVHWAEPITLADGIGCCRKEVALHVPAGCKQAYQNAPYWQDFTIVEDAAPATDIMALEAPAVISSDKVFSVSGQRLEKATKGINIINGKKIVVR
jgi:hypothetical protein